MNAEALFGRSPLFAGIGMPALEGVLRIFQGVRFTDGERLVRQGQPANGAYLIASGAADAVTTLPGGGELRLATLGPGSMLGEMALLESGMRAASVVARGPVSAYFVERERFRMLLAQHDRAAFTIQGRITRALCQRLRDLNAKIVATDAPENAAPPLSGASATPGGVRRGVSSFDYRAFLPILPAFKRFQPEELDAFVGRCEAIELDRGQILFHQGNASETAYAVIRGALEIVHAENGRRHRIGVLGPGRLCGVMALLEGQVHSMSAVAREPAALLEVSRQSFESLVTGDDAVSARFQEAVNRELLMSLARTTVHLTRLISQARIRGGREEKRAETLQRALGMAECGTAG